MKVGISITPDYVRLQDIPLYAEKAEKAGFHSVWIPEHFMYGETFTLLSAAAGRTNRVGLGTGIISIYTRHPALTAMAISTLQTLSGGRAMLGIGIGGEHWMRECFGYSLRGSVDALREGVSLVRSILRGGDVNFRGAHFRAVGLSIHSRGVPPPIYVAAVGPRALRVAGEVGDGVICSAFSSVSYIRQSIKIV
ncbi:MAG: LLM class flavin-dependent oxidoreductase, partial [Nitrososphaerota archaeon]